ncbi:MAG: alpha/beta hydrolase, partial [Betaproteobacteria bacterium]
MKHRAKRASRTRAPRRKSTYVLVHGAWHGGWCWKKVVPALRAAGHE